MAGNINIGIDLGLTNSLIDEINEQMQGMRKALEGQDFEIPVEFGEEIQRSAVELNKQLEKTDKLLKRINQVAKGLGATDIKLIDAKELKKTERQVNAVSDSISKEVEKIGERIKKALSEGDNSKLLKMLDDAANNLFFLGSVAENSADQLEELGRSAMKAGIASMEAANENKQSAEAIAQAAAKSKRAVESAAKGIDEVGQSSEEASQKTERLAKVLNFIKPPKSRGGGGGGGGGEGGGGGDEPPNSVKETYDLFQKNLDEMMSGMRQGDAQWAAAFRETLAIIRKGMEQTADGVDEGSNVIRGAVETFSKFISSNFREANELFGQEVQELIQWRGRLKQAMEAGGLEMDSADEEKLAHAVRQVVASFAQLDAANKVVIEGEKLRARVMDSSRNVTALQEKANRALSESWDPHRIRAVIREYHGLEQVITHSTRMIQKYLNQLNGVDDALREIEEFAKFQLPSVTDEDEAAQLKAQLQTVQMLREAVKERRQEGEKELTQLAQQRQMAAGTLDILKDQARQQAASGKLLTKYRADAERHILALRRGAMVASEVAQDVRSGSWNVDEARYAVQQLTNLEKSARTKAQGVVLALREELARVRQEFEDGAGAFARARGEAPTEANQAHYDSVVQSLNKELAEAQVKAKAVDRVLDEIASDRRTIDLAVNESDVIKRVGKAVDKVEKEVRSVKRLTLDVDFTTPDPDALEDHVLALQKVDSVIKNASKSIPLLVSELKEMAATGTDSKKLDPLIKRLEETSSTAREVRSSLSGLDRGLTASVVKAQKELGETIEEATLALDRQAARMVLLSGDLRKGGEATMTAVRGFQVMRRELRSQEEALQREVDGILQVERALGSLSNEQQKHLLQLRQLLQANREMGRALDQNRTHIERQGKSAEATGQRLRIWNASVMDSIKHQFKFFNAMSVVMSTLFLIRTAVHELIEESKSFSRTLTVLQSDTLSLQESFEKFKDAARQAAVEFGIAITEVSEMVKQFGSAGLSTEESLAGLNAGLQLMISTSADAEQIGRQVAGLYRVFGRSMGEATDLTYGFARITDVLTAVYRNNQAELDEMVQGLSFAAATGKLAGFQFEEISGFLATLNDNLIKSGNAGRGLQVTLAQFANKRAQFEKAFNIQLDPNATIASQFITALEAARDSMGGTEVNMRALEGIFQKFGLRGARSFAVLAQEVDVVRENIERLYDSEGTAALLSNLVKNELANSFERAKQAMLELLREAIEPMQKAFILFTDTVIQFKQGFDALPEIVKGLGGLIIVGAGIAYVMSGAIAMLNLFAAGISFAVGAVKGLTSALFENAAAKELNDAKTKELTGSQIALGASSSGAVGRLKGATAAVSGMTAAISGVLVLLPVAVGLFGWFTTSVADVRKEIAELDAQALELKEARQGLAAFEKAWEQALKRAADETKSLEIRGNALRETIVNQGKAYIDMGITAGRTNAELVKSTASVNAEVRRQVALRRELQEVQQEEAEKLEKEAAIRHVLEKYGTAMVDRVDSENVNLFRIAQDREHLQKLREELEQMEADGMSPLAVGMEALNKSSYMRSEVVRNEYLRVLKTTEDWSKAIESAGQRFSSTMNAAVGVVDKELKEAGTGGLLSDEGAALLTKAFADSLFIDDNEAAEIAKKIQGMLQEVMQRSTSNIKVERIDGLIALTAELDELQKTFDAALSDDTFGSFLNMTDRYTRGLDGRMAELKQTFDGMKELQNNSNVSFENVGVNPQNLRQMFEQSLGAINPEGMKSVISELGIELGAEFSREGAQQLADALSDEDLASRFVGLDRGTDKLTDAMMNQMRQKVIDALTDQSVTGAAQELGLGITNQLLDPKKYEEIVSVLEKFTNFSSDSVRAVRLELEKALQQLEANDFFRLFSFQFASTLIDTFNDRFTAKTIANSFVQMNSELTKTTQELAYVDAELNKILGAQSAQAWIAQKVSEAYEPVLESLIEQGEAAEETKEQAFERVKAEFLTSEEGKNMLDLLQRQLNASVQIKNQSRAIAIEMQNRRAAQAEIALQARLEAQQSRGEVSLKIQERKLLRQKINDQARLLKLQEELLGVGMASLAAQNELEQSRQELVSLLREELQLLYEMEAAHFSITAEAERLISPLNKAAGLQSDYLGVVSQLNVLNRERERITGRELKNDNDRITQISDLQKNYSDIVDLADTLFDIEKKLLEEQKKSNAAYRNRLGLLQQIKGTFAENFSEIEAQLSSALNAQFDANPIQAAAAAAGQLGIQFGWALKEGTALIPQLIEGAKRGEISLLGFGAEVRRIGQQFNGLNEEVQKVDDRIKNLSTREFESASKAFQNAMGRENIEDAQAALDRMVDSSAEMYEKDRTRFILSREEMLKYYDDLETLRAQQEDGLSVDNMLVGITRLREYLKELTAEAYKIRLDITGDHEALTEILRGGTIEGGLIEPTTTHARNIQQFSSTVEDAVFRGTSSAMSKFLGYEMGSYAPKDSEELVTRVMNAIALKESSHNVNAFNPGGKGIGANGVFQIRGPMAAGYGIDARNLIGDATTSITIFAKEMRRYADRHMWDPKRIGLMWNRGPGTLDSVNEKMMEGSDWETAIHDVLRPVLTERIKRSVERGRITEGEGAEELAKVPAALAAAHRYTMHLERLVNSEGLDATKWAFSEEDRKILGFDQQATVDLTTSTQELEKTNQHLIDTIQNSIGKSGGLIPQELSTGGFLPGYGGGDRIPALLESGEFVIPKEAVSKYGTGFFESLRRGKLKGFRTGGMVGAGVDFMDPKQNSNFWAWIKDLPQERQAEEIYKQLRALNKNGAAALKAAEGSWEAAKASSLFLKDAAQDPEAGLTRAEVRAAHSTLREMLAQPSLADVASSFREASAEDQQWQRESLSLFRQMLSAPRMGDLRGYARESGQRDTGQEISEYKKRIAELEALDAVWKSRNAAWFDADKNSPSTTDREIAGYKKRIAELEAVDAVWKSRNAAWFAADKAFEEKRAESARQPESSIQYELKISEGFMGDSIPELSAAISSTVEDATAAGLASHVVQQAIAMWAKPVEEVTKQAVAGAGGPSDPSKLISEGERANTDRFGRFMNDGPSKADLDEMDKAIREAFTEAAEKAWKTSKVVNTVVKVFDTASKFFNNAIDLGFINEGAKAVKEAIATYREAIRTATEGFQASVASAEDTLRSNSSSIYDYIDGIQQAEKAYYDQRIQAARELNKTMKETQELFKTALADGLTKSFDNIKTSLDAVTPSMERMIKAGNLLGQSATVRNDVMGQAHLGVKQARAAQLDANANYAGAFGRGDEAEIAEAAKHLDVASQRYEMSVKSFDQTSKKLNDMFLKEAGTLIGGAVLNILNAGFSAIVGPLISTAAKALEPGGLQEYVQSMITFLDQLIASAPQIIDEIVRELPRLIQALAERIPEIVQLFAEAIPEIVRVIAETAIPALAEALPKIINSLGEALPDLIRVLIPAVVDMALAVINNIPEIVHHLAAALPVLIGELIKAAPRIILSLMTLPLELITGLITGFFSTLPEVLLDVITELPGLIWEGLKGAFKQLVDSIERFAQRLVGRKSDDQKAAREQLKELGYSWVERQVMRSTPLARHKLSEEEKQLFRVLYPKAGFRHGGRIPGFGGGDVFPAMLEPGEYVIPKEAVRALGTPYFDSLRRVDSLPKFRHGGAVGSFRSSPRAQSSSPTQISMNATVNVSGNSSRAERRRAAKETVSMLDSELAKLKRNRNSKFYRD